MVNIVELWPAIALTAVVVTGKVIIAWLALHKTEPKDRPKIITALAEMFRWWRFR